MAKYIKTEEGYKAFDVPYVVDIVGSDEYGETSFAMVRGTFAEIKKRFFNKVPIQFNICKFDGRNLYTMHFVEGLYNEEDESIDMIISNKDYTTTHRMSIFSDNHISYYET